MTAYNLLTVLGPTACGKTRFSVQLAHQLGGEIISADSRQVYRRMNLGTGKDLDEYQQVDPPIAFHLIDVADAGYQYNVFEYQRDFVVAFGQIVARGKWPILCGGSGLYLEAALKGYRMDEVPVNEALREKLSGKTLDELKQMLQQYKTLHNTTDVDTVKRAVRAIEIADYYQHHPPKKQADYPALQPLIVGLSLDRDERREMITKRLHERLENGLIDEVRSLLQSGLSAESLIYYGLEYKFVTLFLTGQLPYETMVRQLEQAIHQFAKRQMTWFRGMERRGFHIHWLDARLPLQTRCDMVLQWLHPW
ncbi:MAG: tRNA (adenosine(37)-N6)-dimethylallyltransferase MiaA [Microbacter sp.]